MPRSGEQARDRLRQAALDLFRERGYDSTTAAQIAERAGVTERTFFRHFPDKREVLFDGEAAVGAHLARGVADAPDGLDPLELLGYGLSATVPMLEANRAFAEPRQAVIEATPALRERALTKEATLVAGLAAALQARGLPVARATLAAQLGMAALGQATQAWFDRPDADLDALLTQALDDVRALAAGR